MKRIAIYIFIAICIGSITLSYLLYRNNSELKATLSTTQDKLSVIEENSQKNRPFQNSGQKQIPPDWITYKNDKYGFELGLPPSWKDYKIHEYSTPFGEAEATYSIDMYSKEWNKDVQMLILSVYRPSNYLNNINRIPLSYGIKGDYGTLLSENEYVIAYWSCPQAPNEFKDIVKDIPSIVKTYLVIKY